MITLNRPNVDITGFINAYRVYSLISIKGTALLFMKR